MIPSEVKQFKNFIKDDYCVMNVPKYTANKHFVVIDEGCEENKDSACCRNGKYTRGNVCRQPTGPCQLPDMCMGISALCFKGLFTKRDGEPCGDGEAGRYCFKGKCKEGTPTEAGPTCAEKCANGGTCNNKGHCHCPDGFAPPFCKHSGIGGSVDTGAASCTMNGDQLICSCKEPQWVKDTKDERMCNRNQVHPCDQPNKGGCSDICEKQTSSSSPMEEYVIDITTGAKTYTCKCNPTKNYRYYQRRLVDDFTCKDRICEWENGSFLNGKLYEVKYPPARYSQSTCKHICIRNYEAFGATYSASEKKCWCHYGDNKINIQNGGAKKDYQSCFDKDMPKLCADKKGESCEQYRGTEYCSWKHEEIRSKCRLTCDYCFEGQIKPIKGNDDSLVEALSMKNLLEDIEVVAKEIIQITSENDGKE